MNNEHSINFRTIRSRSGDQRADFEELAFLLFSRENAEVGSAIRRNGAGGDGGMEGVIIDAASRPVKGLQSKFFVEKLDVTQWRDLDSSIRTALKNNAADSALNEITITLPRNLTPKQRQKWEALTTAWQALAAELNYANQVSFQLWDESHLRELLLRPEHRGLLLYYFEGPEFDITRCRKKTADTIMGLGGRYLPKLHVSTEAEDILHTFLRSERSREQFLDEARNRLSKSLRTQAPNNEWGSELRSLYFEVSTRRLKILDSIGDGVSLPSSFHKLAEVLESASISYRTFLSGLRKLIPPRKIRPYSSMGLYEGSRHPEEEVYRAFDNDERELSIFASFIRSRIAADAQCLLLTGEPGRGKTHVLAEICARYAEQGGVVLFSEGATFSGNELPWLQLMRWADFPSHRVSDFLAALSAMAQITKLSALICIDALNETPNRDLWRSCILNFSAELHNYPSVKLIVSCRSDYVRHTLPDILNEKRADRWAFAEHHGLGTRVLDALPKYLEAYNVRGFALPPLTREFQTPLFLRIFCEAYANETPEPGTPSLSIVLKHYSSRKAAYIGSRIDCDPSQVLNALREIGEAMHGGRSLQMDEQAARHICKEHHAVSESSKSLYNALLSEGILAEFPGPMDILGPMYFVRFTYERVWDYFLSQHLLPSKGELAPAVLAKIRDYDWRRTHSGIFSMLAIRLAEERNQEICDLTGENKQPDFDVVHVVLDGLSWRTVDSFSERTAEVIGYAIKLGYINTEFDAFVRVVPIVSHPWNGEYLHARLVNLSLCDRDRSWTFWVNESLMDSDSSSPTLEWLNWAECANLEKVPPEQLLLLAIFTAWCLSTTVVKQRLRLVSALTRIVAGRTAIACQLANRFKQVNDPYIKERVLLALAGAAQHAMQGDLALADLASIVYESVFAGPEVDPHILVRHYAAEICVQAEAKGVLLPSVTPSAFRPPWRTKWPHIWSSKRIERLKKEYGRFASRMFASVEPGPGLGYGPWGRYVMSSYVSCFQGRQLSASPDTKGESRFDVQRAMRYVIQRVFEMGWDPTVADTHPEGYDEIGGSPQVERLSKKYQWIALYELLGYLADHYHFDDYESKARPFVSATQLDPRDLLDPFVMQAPEIAEGFSWNLIRPESPWWRGKLDPFPRPLDHNFQRIVATRLEMDNPRKVIELNDGKGDWLTLSAYHKWSEPVPIWMDDFMAPHVSIEMAIQSYLVRPAQVHSLLAHLNHDEVTNGRLWLEEPEFGQPMARLRDYPEGQERLRQRCKMDSRRETSTWATGAISTTCRCAPDEEHRRLKAGSVPSPQLMDLDDLRWMGNDFDFALAGSREAVIRYMGQNYQGACMAKRQELERWLKDSGWKLVWRFYGFKFRTKEIVECHGRVYWAVYTLGEDGKIVLEGGATCACPTSCCDNQKLPWSADC